MTEENLKCTLCDALEDPIKVGTYCSLVRFLYNEDRPETIQSLLNEQTVQAKTVVLNSHISRPTAEAYMEALSLLGSLSGMVHDISVAGHWGLQAMPGSWASSGACRMYSKGDK